MAGGRGEARPPGWRVDPGRHELHVGTSSAAIAHVAAVEVTAPAGASTPAAAVAWRRYRARMSDAPASAPSDGAPAFAPGQVVTVFRSRGAARGRGRVRAPPRRRSSSLALTMPGLVDVKSFTADDGEHVTIATFADEDSQRAWREHAEHRVAQQAGRDRFYAEYTLQVCETVRARSFSAADGVQR